MYLHRWQLSTASTSTSHIFTDQHDQFWAKGSNQHQAAPAIGGEEEPHLFSTDPLFPLMITNSGLEGFRELLHIQLKLHDLVDLDQLPSPSLLFKLNRHNYSNLPWQSSHCAFSPFPSPPLQPLVLHVSQTVHNSRYGGITIVYRKKKKCNFPSSPWWHSVFAGTSKHLEEFQGEGPEADPWSTTALSWTQGCHGFMFGIFPPLDSLLYTSLHRDYPAFILTCLI